MASTWLPSLNALRAFEAAARHLSYKMAAEELRVSPAAVKQLVSKLETSVGAPLLERDGQGLALTPRGKAGLGDLSSAVELLGSGVRKLRGTDNKKHLILTVEASFATAWLVPRLEDFRAKFPQVNVLVESSQQIIDLERSEVDVAIRYGVESDAGLTVHRLFDDQIFPACSPALAKGPPELKGLEDLTAAPLIHWDLTRVEWARATRRWFVWENWLAHVGACFEASGEGLHFSDYGLAVQAAIAGQGVVLASWPILREPVEAGLLVRPFAQIVTTDIGYDLVTTQEARSRPEVDAFIAWILDVSSRA